jgi:glycopeptide antibiotics resistance protein
MPFGVLLAAILSQHKWHWHVAGRVFGAALAGFGFSAAIELAQHLIPGRVSDPGDVLMNGSGALIGAALVAIIVHIYRTYFEFREATRIAGR